MLYRLPLNCLVWRPVQYAVTSKLAVSVTKMERDTTKTQPDLETTAAKSSSDLRVGLVGLTILGKCRTL